jgi:hypothetical protein
MRKTSIRQVRRNAMDRSIKGMIQEFAGAGMPVIVVGIVEKLSPLKVRLQSDSKIELSAASLIIPDRIMLGQEWCNCHCVNCSCDHNHKLKRKLKKDDELYLLSLNNNKLYYALDKV